MPEEDAGQSCFTWRPHSGGWGSSEPELFWVPRQAFWPSIAPRPKSISLPGSRQPAGVLQEPSVRTGQPVPAKVLLSAAGSAAAAAVVCLLLLWKHTLPHQMSPL